MDIHQEFTEIVEKQDIEVVFLFFKKLSKKERRDLVKTIRSLAAYYSEYVTTNFISSSIRGTNTQIEMLAGAALVCFTYKEFEKFRQGAVRHEMAEKIFEFYLPEWLNDYLNNTADHTQFSRIIIDYDVIMSWVKKGLIQPSPQLIVKHLPTFLSEHFEKDNRFIFYWKNEKLYKYPETLESHIWFFFEYESIIHKSERSVWHQETNTSEDFSWKFTFKELADKGEIDRSRLLKGCLSIIFKGADKVFVNWMADLFEHLKPQHKELIPLVENLVNLLNSLFPKARNIALKHLKKLAIVKNFPIDEFLAFPSLLLVSESKTTVNRTLMVLEVIAKKYTDRKNEICLLATQALFQNDPGIQKRAAKLIATYGDISDQTLVGELANYRDLLLSDAKKLLENYFATQEEIIESDSEIAIFESNDVLSPENRVQIPENFDDLIFLASQAFDNNNPLDFDLLPAALINCEFELDAENVNRFEPALQRAFKIVTGDLRGNMGALDRMLATFFLHYIKIIINQFPKGAKSLRLVWNAEVRKHRGNNTFETLFSTNIPPLSRWSEYNSNAQIYKPFLLKLQEALILIRRQINLPLLSTPTHQGFWIDPKSLIERIKLWQSQNTAWGTVDFQLALSRTYLEDAEKYLDLVQSDIKGEVKNQLCFLFDKNALPVKPFSEIADWWAISIIKNPEKIYEEFNSFSYAQVPRAEYTGDYFWQVKDGQFNYSTWDYLVDKLVRFTDYGKALHIDIETKTAQSSFFKSIFNQANKFIEGDQFLLYDHLEFQGNWWDRMGNDMKRCLGLVPNNYEKLLGHIIHYCLRFPENITADGKKMLINTLQQLIHSRKGLGEMGHLLLASSMISPDKTIKSMAGECWIEKVSKNLINNDLLGQNLGKYFGISFAPLKRFTDLLTETMTRISLLHDFALKMLLENMIREMHQKPINGLKKLLETYAEILHKTGDTPPQFLDHKCKQWSKNVQLKKIIGSFS